MSPFDQSLIRYLDGFPYVKPDWRAKPLEDSILLSLWNNEVEPDVAEATRSAMRVVAHEILDHFHMRLDADALVKCESPIQRLLFLALFVMGRHLCHRGRIMVLGKETRVLFTEAGTSFPHVSIVPEYEVEDYRADFLVEYAEAFPRRQANPDPRPPVAFARFLVECDGHEFHERTRDQAARDKKKDRDLQLRGYQVFRFTGSEIHRDPFGCAGQCFAFLARKVDEELTAYKVRFPMTQADVDRI